MPLIIDAQEQPITTVFNNTNQLAADTGAMLFGRAITATLHVSPDGWGTDGSSWARAYQTVQVALSAASIDANDATLILIAPHATNYDINITGDPTWTGNYVLMGSHRNWVKIKNNHGSATSIMKFSGKISLVNLTIDCGTGTNNGVIITGASLRGARLRKVYFECEDVTGAQTALEISGGAEYAKMEDVMFDGVVAHTRAMLLDNCKLSDFRNIQFYDCAKGVQITDVASDDNKFDDLMFHSCALGLDLDAGNRQMFEHIDFHNCTRNVDDEVGGHEWADIHGSFPLTLLPDNFTGVDLDTAAGANTWGTDTEILAAAGRDNPFRVIGFSVEVDAAEKFRIRLSADSGSTHFADIQVEGSIAVAERTAIQLPAGTEEIFNKGTRISGSSKSESGSDTATIWLQIQEI